MNGYLTSSLRLCISVVINHPAKSAEFRGALSRVMLCRMDGDDVACPPDLPLLTGDMPGVGGVIKAYDEDFIVTEMPLYEASGRGTHVYFEIEKQGLATWAAIRYIAGELGKRPRDIGYAGLKDAHGVTRQWFSVEHVDADRVADLALPRIRILRVTHHTNKIKLGHLARNRFELKIRRMQEGSLDRARAIIDVLVSRGCPNYFGPQRFGVRGDNAAIGRAVLQGDLDEAVALILGRAGPFDHGAPQAARELFDHGDLEAAATTWPGKFETQARMCRSLIESGGDARLAWRAVDHTVRRLYVSSVQSELFNRILARRIATIARLEQGDLAWKHANGACFKVEDASAEQPRCDAFEISPTGPLFGRKMTDAGGAPGRREAEVLAASGLTKEQFRPRDGIQLDGARRPLRVPIAEPAVDGGTDNRGAFLRLAFALPPGAYATNVTREICGKMSP